MKVENYSYIRHTNLHKNRYAKLFVENVATNDNVYLIIFHQELVKLFQIIQKNLHNDLTEDDIKEILLDVHNLNITYNIADGKLLQINVKELDNQYEYLYSLIKI